MESDVEDTENLFRTYPKTLSGEGEIFIRTVKSHLKLHRDLKSTLPPE